MRGTDDSDFDLRALHSSDDSSRYLIDCVCLVIGRPTGASRAAA
jgi:hypothetical protein